jgi:8-oxo-dGTP pyrophosphatase MutT (NUDIX family)
MQKSNYPNTFYRVSVKAIIRNTAGEVLVVREKGSNWSLPGGGLDHNEPIESCLKRELYEEALITASFHTRVVGVDNDKIFSHAKQAWLLWVVCELVFDELLEYGIGEDADEIRFVDPVIFKGSLYRSEQLVYKWCVNPTAV